MQITVVALLCHSLAPLEAPACREEIVVQADMAMLACELSQPALADWKSKSIYAARSWSIARVKCVVGDYVIRETL